jgi:2-keto-4-pentenoate hydratase
MGALGGEACGCKIGATSVQVHRLMNCKAPFFSPILREHLLENGSTYRIPAGLLGVECEFGFVMHRDFPKPSGASNTAALQPAIAECFVGLKLVGRRVVADVPLTEELWR